VSAVLLLQEQFVNCPSKFYGATTPAVAAGCERPEAHARNSFQLAATNVQPETVSYASEARTVMMSCSWLNSSAMMSLATPSLLRRREH
jgi:hypothetical protein